jgi:hypothetical protein
MHIKLASSSSSSLIHHLLHILITTINMNGPNFYTKNQAISLEFWKHNSVICYSFEKLSENDYFKMKGAISTSAGNAKKRK